MMSLNKFTDFKVGDVVRHMNFAHNRYDFYCIEHLNDPMLFIERLDNYTGKLYKCNYREVALSSMEEYVATKVLEV